MVLDALIKIKNEMDSTLTFRRSCREGQETHYFYSSLVFVGLFLSCIVTQVFILLY